MTHLLRDHAARSLVNTEGAADRACRVPFLLNATATSRSSDVRCGGLDRGEHFLGTSGETGADYVALPGDVPPTFPWFALRLGRRPVGSSARSAPVRRLLSHWVGQTDRKVGARTPRIGLHDVRAGPSLRSGVRPPLLLPGARLAGSSVADDPAFSLADFDRYLEEHGLLEEDVPGAFALWIAQHTTGRVPRFEKVERGEPADGVVIERRRPLARLKDFDRYREGAGVRRGV
jgi:hypothetical protein